jgi:hypothetical protein
MLHIVRLEIRMQVLLMSRINFPQKISELKDFY